jgi:2-oxoglutarate ferredoxin oxidoreductase subunit gamma
MSRYEIRYGAVGGQGLLTAGALLANIAVTMENKFAAESPTYTASVRGGPTKVDIIISDKKILFPQANAIDFFVCTEQKPFDLYKERLKDDATVIIDTHLVKELGSTRNWKLKRIPLIYETKKQLGNIVLTSVVTLSLTQKITGIIGYQNMVKYIRKWAPHGYIELNLKAIEVGQELAK